MDIKPCLDHLERRTRERPAHADTWKDLGLALSYDGQRDEALAALEHALDCNPQYAEARLIRCFLLGESGWVDEGFRDFRRAQKQSPDSFETVFSLGVFCMRHGWDETGLSLLTRAEEQRGRVPYVLLHAAAAHRAAGDETAARERLYRACAAATSLPLDGDHLDDPSVLQVVAKWRDPHFAQAALLLSDYLSQQNDWTSAWDVLEEAHQRFPGHARLMVGMGKNLLARGEADQAAEWMSAAIGIHRTCDEAHLELGFLRAESQALDDAEEALRTAAGLRPLYPDYRFHLGTFLMERGKVEEATEEFRRVLTLNPEYAHAALHLANGYLDLGRFDEAIAALDGSPCESWPEALVVSAQAFWKRGERRRAETLLDRVIEVDPTNIEARELRRRVGSE